MHTCRSCSSFSLPLHAPFVALVFLTLVIVWAANSWWVGLPVMLAVLGLAHCSGLGPWQMKYLRGEALSQDFRLAQYIGCEIVNEPEERSQGRALVILGTKLVLENLLQLWLQSSYLSLSFDRVDSSARLQAMASIAVGIGVAGRLLGPVFTSTLQSPAIEAPQ